jgi:hypothetical protein
VLDGRQCEVDHRAFYEREARTQYRAGQHPRLVALRACGATTGSGQLGPVTGLLRTVRGRRHYVVPVVCAGCARTVRSQSSRRGFAVRRVCLLRFSVHLDACTLSRRCSPSIDRRACTRSLGEACILHRFRRAFKNSSGRIPPCLTGTGQILTTLSSFAATPAVLNGSSRAISFMARTMCMARRVLTSPSGGACRGGGEPRQRLFRTCRLEKSGRGPDSRHVQALSAPPARCRNREPAAPFRRSPVAEHLCKTPAHD